MDDPYAVLDDVCCEGFLPGNEEPDLMPHLYEIVGKVYRCRYDTVCLWIEYVEPEGYMHRDWNPSISAVEILAELP